MQIRAGALLVIGILLFSSLMSSAVCACQRSDDRSTSPSSQRTSQMPNVAAKPDSRTSIEKWVEPTSLLKELDLLSGHTFTAKWAESVKQAIDNLVNNRGIGDPVSKTSFATLQAKIEEANWYIVQSSTTRVANSEFATGTLATYLRRVRYGLQRRLSVWRTVHELAGVEYEYTTDITAQDAGGIFSVSRSRLSFEDVEAGWASYLELDEAEKVFNSITPNTRRQKTAARKLLGRLHSPALTIEQQQHLTRIIDPEVNLVLRRTAVQPVKLERFLKRLEYLEGEGNGAGEFHLNDDYQNLLWTGDIKYRNVADQLQRHYRRENFCVAVSEKLINNLVPDLPDSSEPYQDQILGAQVYGQNEISNTIRIKLLPDANQVSLRLETDGEVRSRISAQQSGVTVHNVGNSRFKVMKRLVFGRYGVSQESAQSSSEVNNQIVGIRSRMDGVPLLGWLTRKVAQQKIQQQAPATQQITKSKLEHQAKQRFEQEVHTNLMQLRNYLNNKILEPLIAMDLDPDPVVTNTTSERIEMRYRLAGRDQMAANSIRPDPIPGSLMSLQIHESAINNMVQRIEIAGKDFNPVGLQEHLQRVLGVNLFASAHQIDQKVEFQFAPFDPVRVDFEDNQIALSINLKSLRINNGKRWRNLQVKTRYNPVARGMVFELTQDDNGISLKGRKLNIGDQIAIRAVCTKLFEKNMRFSALPQSLAEKLGTGPLGINQLIVSEGWVGLSINDGRRMARSIHRPQYPEARTGLGEILQNIGKAVRR